MSLAKVARACFCEAKDDKGETVQQTANVGDIVCIGERTKLQKLDTFIARGGQWAVFIYAAKVIKVKGGHTMWTFDIGARQLRAPLAVAVPSADQGDDLPF